MPTLAGADGEPDRQVRFPCPRRPKEDDIVLCRDEIEGSQMGYSITLQTASVVEVELLQRFTGRKAGGTDPGFAAVTFSRGDFPLQARNQKFFVGPTLFSCPLGQSSGGIAQGRCFEGAGQEIQLGSQIMLGLPGSGVVAGHSASVPS
ncbi:hypothetical protein SZ00_06347 (plasmid) [Rhodococcus sp. AD45]|nr:hypothetical protein SZ00_06347 [Rhodococcus sp. AD45]